MKQFRRIFYALLIVALAALIVTMAMREGWRAVLKAFVDGLPIIGVVVLTIGGIKFLNRRERAMSRRYYRHGSLAEGTIVSVELLGSAYVVAADFTVNGQTYRATSGRLQKMPGRKVGDLVPVYYNPNRPEDNSILDGDLILPRQ